MADNLDRGVTVTLSSSWQLLSSLVDATDNAILGIWEDATFHSTATNTAVIYVAVNVGTSPTTNASGVPLAADDYRAFNAVNLTQTYVKSASSTPTLELTGIPTA